MTRLFDVLNEDYQAMREADKENLISAAQIQPVRGMTQGHLDRVSDWLEQNKMGSLRPDPRTPGKVLFVPSPPATTDEMDDRMRAFFQALHGKFGMDPFHQHNWLLKTVPG